MVQETNPKYSENGEACSKDNSTTTILIVVFVFLFGSSLFFIGYLLSEKKKHDKIKLEMDDAEDEEIN